MMFFSFQKRGRRGSSGIMLVGVLIALTLLLAACGNSGTTGSSNVPTPNTKTPTVTPPNDLITPGTLTVGSDTTYPPQEYIDTTTHQAAGFDVDLITAIAQRMGLQAKVETTNFNTIINSLSSRRFDVVISAVSITPDRQKLADFIPYFSAGESLLVQNGNPKHITNVSQLCGQNVGVQNGTIEQTDLQTANTACTKAGKPAIHITALTNQTDVIQLLATNRVVATYQDSPVTDYYIKLHPGQFVVGGSVVNAGPEGIVIRKGDSSMFNAVKTAFNELKASGAYHALIQKWGLTDEEITLIDRWANYA